MPLVLILLAGSLAWMLAGLARAESWTVQTVSMRDYLLATEVIETLEGLGYAAYAEFAMFSGLQYTRVRVGCFDGREGAERMARHLRGAVTEDAVAQPLSEGAAVSDCTSITVGFFKPQTWNVFDLAPDTVVFEVAVSGRLAYLQHRGGAWSVLQSAPTPSAERGDPKGPFVQAQIAGRPLVMFQRGDALVAACPGLLLWQGQEVAVVDDGDAVLSCRPGTGLAP